MYVCMTRMYVSRLRDISLYEYICSCMCYVHKDTARLDMIGVVFSPYIRVTRARAETRAHARAHRNLR